MCTCYIGIMTGKKKMVAQGFREVEGKMLVEQIEGKTPGDTAGAKIKKCRFWV